MYLGPVPTPYLCRLTWKPQHRLKNSPSQMFTVPFADTMKATIVVTAIVAAASIKTGTSSTMSAAATLSLLDGVM